MDKETFFMALALDKELHEYESHKHSLEELKGNCELELMIHSGTSRVPLKGTLYDENFFQKYMEALDKKITELKEEFKNL